LRIRDVDAIMLRLSDEIYERDALAIKGGAEHPMEVLLVMVETDDGLVGYGKSISYGGLYAVHAAVKRVLSPMLRAVSAFIIICSAHVHWFLRPLNAMRYAESHEISKYERR
jgi:L-alanine-DL-glutamate epimerase-like enolase superfamily enzyme